MSPSVSCRGCGFECVCEPQGPRLAIRAKSSTNPGGRDLGPGCQRGDLRDKQEVKFCYDSKHEAIFFLFFLTLPNFTHSRANKLIWCVFILTYNIKEL